MFVSSWAQLQGTLLTTIWAPTPTVARVIDREALHVSPPLQPFPARGEDPGHRRMPAWHSSPGPPAFGTLSLMSACLCRRVCRTCGRSWPLETGWQRQKTIRRQGYLSGGNLSKVCVQNHQSDVLHRHHHDHLRGSCYHLHAYSRVPGAIHAGYRWAQWPTDPQWTNPRRASERPRHEGRAGRLCPSWAVAHA